MWPPAQMGITAYQPEFLFAEGRLQPGKPLLVDPDGRVAPASASPDEVVVLAGRALLPGLVNGHSHAFQRLLRGQTEYVAAGHHSDDFWSWRELMYRFAGSLSPEALYDVSRQTFLEMALAGVTTVGEFHYLHHQPDGTPYANPNELAHRVIAAARDVGLRIVLLRVAYARAGFEVAANPRQRRFLEPDVETFLRHTGQLEAAVRSDAAVSVGLAPHSVRALSSDWLRPLAAAAGTRPVHMHVSEQPAEIDACLAEHGVRPVELLSKLGLLGPRFTAVHAIHLEPSEVSLLGKAAATVCACPSTERNLGDGTVLADSLHAAGAALSLGSDSQASIDLLEEARQLEGNLRLLRRRRAVLDPGTGDPAGLASWLLRAATVNGQRSLGLRGGSLAPGEPADFFTVQLDHPSVVGAPEGALLPALVFGADKAAIREVAVQGKLVVSEGRHARQEEISRRYAAALKGATA